MRTICYCLFIRKSVVALCSSVVVQYDVSSENEIAIVRSLRPRLVIYRVFFYIWQYDYRRMAFGLCVSYRTEIFREC